ncbi:sentrin-specific protease 7 isoform X2 [Archocentrus centrarchus]|uniref:sentrin-specific protease 7 isoform X2 n=1 Tax=Archocentrus centrarchus TaxID=63155 RepID=UPI0011EA084A|nr:sentrin-specific protease 7-like isoform X2 [Archocentrus centrarchus]
MMEQRRALTIPFTVDKDNLVSWTAFADCKFRRRKPPHKNGSTKFEPSHTAMITLEMARRKPLLILTDVLKTEFGKEYMERIRKSHSMNNKGQTPNRRRESSRCREEPPTYRDTRSNQKEAGNNSSKSVTPKCNQRTTPQTSQRLSLRRRPPNADDKQDKEEGKDIEEVIISKDNTEDDKFAEVVDCGLSLSWEPAEDIASCDSSIKEKWTESEKDVQPILKRKRKDSGFQCNGTGSPKRHRESVLRLTGENGGDGGAASAHVCHVDSTEDGGLESLDRCIVRFTVGEDNETEVLVPDLEAGDFIGSPRQRLSFTQDNGNQISPSEPIVLSSDDEEGGDVSQGCSQVRTLVAVEDTVIKGQSSQEAEAKQEVTPDMQVLQLVVEDPTRSVTASPRLDVDYSCMEMAFSSLHCGVYHGKANGVIAIDENKISIPLKDTSEELEVKLTFECKELRRYSVWEQHELEERQLCFKGDEEPTPAAVLLFCVSETAAAAIQQDLCLLSAKKDGATNTGMTSPFILLTLREPLEGMEGALLRSLLDIVCLKTLANEQSNLSCSKDRFNGLGDILSPVLSLDDSIELIRRTGLDSFLLSMLGVKNTDTEPEEDKNPTAVEKESVLDTEVAPEPDTGTSSPKPKVDHEEQEIEHPSDKEKEEPTPVYTVCHRRTKGSYSVSLCKPDSNWTKYKHQGLARRLIQFPPPPLKGGITVTMEDLQCLDSGQYLNDVIIDFYLKYLLQNASAAVAERSHIFSSFFYKQLTRRDNASEGGNSDSCQRQRRHQRVKTWTRHVDIFKKDFLFVPVNQEAHWYLVVICFPGLDEPKLEDWTSPNSQAGKSNDGTGESESQDQAQGRESPNNDAERSPMRSDNMDTQTENAQEELAKDPPPNPVNCTELTCQKKTVCKRPCILIMDSLKLSLHERVFKLLREYLQSEWEVRRGSPRDFGPDQMKSSHCHVPLQDNSSDCGLYLLQYVECFLKDPVVHFDLPLYLERWFPRQQVWRKRDEIRDLILNLYRHQNPEPRRDTRSSSVAEHVTFL